MSGQPGIVNDVVQCSSSTTGHPGFIGPKWPRHWIALLQTVAVRKEIELPHRHDLFIPGPHVTRKPANAAAQQRGSPGALRTSLALQLWCKSQCRHEYANAVRQPKLLPTVSSASPATECINSKHAQSLKTMLESLLASYELVITNMLNGIPMSVNVQLRSLL